MNATRPRLDRVARLAVPAVVLAVAACGSAPPAPSAPSAPPTSPTPPTPPTPSAETFPCPPLLPTGARCLRGRDAIGAPYVIALPAGWQPATGVLVVHAHGGPELGAPTFRRSEDDLVRWAVTVQAGYAWVGAAYRRGGLGVTMAAEDVERSRLAFVQQFGQPRRTLLHGQSYGAGVAAKAAERDAPLDAPAGAPRRYDGLVLTSGVLGGGVTAYTFRLDLRAVYQAVCHNHPRRDEPPYPLWQGLPMDARLPNAQLAERVRECTGIGLPAAERTPQQNANLKAILDALPVEERSLLPHLQWATHHFQDLTQKRLDNRNPFDNTRAEYRHGTSPAEQRQFNAEVPRYAADPAAVAALDADSKPTGRTSLPTVSLHGISDPTAFVELDRVYRDLRVQAGTADRLVQAFTVSREHSFLHAPEYPALFGALLDWIDRGEKPTPDTLLTRCKAFEPRFGEAGQSPCRIDPAFYPKPLAERLPPRN